MITQEKMFVATCDVCGNDVETDEGYIPYFNLESDCKDVLRDNDWLIGDGEEGEAGKVYCPDCYSRDDDDKIVIKEVSNGL